MMLHQKYLKEFIGGTNGVADLEKQVFMQLSPLPKGGLEQYATRIRLFLSASYIKDGKSVDISAATLLNQAYSLYTTAAFSLRDELLSKQLATLAVQIAALLRVATHCLGIRLPALIKAAGFTQKYLAACDKLTVAEQPAARAKLRCDVDEVFVNLPVVTDATTYDVSAIMSVGLSAKVAPGKAPALVHFKDLFMSAVDLPVGGPDNLFAAALATGLDSSWFPQQPTTEGMS